MPVPLRPLARQYLDLAAVAADEELAEAQCYWATKLADPPPVLALPFDFRRPATATHAGAVIKVRFDPFVVAGLRALAARRHATLFMTLHAALVLLLHRYTNESEILVGAPVAGREAQDCEDQIGLFIN